MSDRQQRVSESPTGSEDAENGRAYPLSYVWRWLTNKRVRETRRMTRRGYTLEWGSDGRTFWN